MMIASVDGEQQMPLKLLVLHKGCNSPCMGGTGWGSTGEKAALQKGPGGQIEWKDCIRKRPGSRSREAITDHNWSTVSDFKLPGTREILTNWREPWWRVIKMIRCLEHMAC